MAPCTERGRELADLVEVCRRAQIGEIVLAKFAIYQRSSACILKNLTGQREARALMIGSVARVQRQILPEIASISIFTAWGSGVVVQQRLCGHHHGPA